MKDTLGNGVLYYYCYFHIILFWFCYYMWLHISKCKFIMKNFHVQGLLLVWEVFSLFITTVLTNKDIYMFNILVCQSFVKRKVVLIAFCQSRWYGLKFFIIFFFLWYNTETIQSSNAKGLNFCFILLSSEALWSWYRFLSDHFLTLLFIRLFEKWDVL